MIEADESSIRVVEVFNALSLVLPIYDDEARKVYNGIFGGDIAELIPRFFMDIARASIVDPDSFTTYMNFLYEGINYIRGDRKNMPMFEDDPNYFIEARERAKKVLKQWNVKVIEKK